MGDPVVHFEIIGRDPSRLRGFLGELFGWEFDTSTPVHEAVSAPTDYGFISPDAGGIPGGVGGGSNHPPRAIFYVSVPDVEKRLQRAEALGGQRVIGPVTAPSGLVVGHFRDVEGNLIGLATLPASAG